MTIRPVRLQLSRRKGFSLQRLSAETNGLPAVNCARPSKWGNPFIAHDWRASFRAVSFGEKGNQAGRNAAAVKVFRLWLTAKRRAIKKDTRTFWEREVMTVTAKEPPPVSEIETLLRGKNLACWCGPESPCHADVLLELANK